MARGRAGARSDHPAGKSAARHTTRAAVVVDRTRLMPRAELGQHSDAPRPWSCWILGADRRPVSGEGPMRRSDSVPAAGLVIEDHDGGQLGSRPHESAGRGAGRPHQVDARGQLGST